MLDWGREYLMCPPTFFDVEYAINPWMTSSARVDRDLAYAQWQQLKKTFLAAGAKVREMLPVDGLPDLVFTANAGIVNEKRFVPSHFKNVERRGETAYNKKWFAQNNFVIDQLPHNVVHEGAGDALPFGPLESRVLLSAFAARSEFVAHAMLERMLDVRVISMRLTGDWLYHLDLAFTPVTNHRAMFAPMAFDRESIRVLRQTVPELFALENEEAMSFCCNSVVINNVIVMPTCPVRVGRQLEAWGIEAVECDVGEFLKAGGGCRCLSLALDVRLSQDKTQ